MSKIHEKTSMKSKQIILEAKLNQLEEEIESENAINVKMTDIMPVKNTYVHESMVRKAIDSAIEDIDEFNSQDEQTEGIFNSRFISALILNQKNFSINFR